MKKSRIFLIVLLSFLSLSFILGGSFYLYATNGVVLDENKLTLSSQSVELYDEQNRPIENASTGFPNANFSLSTLPKAVKYAFIDTEDKRFYSHDGFDYKRMAKAVLTNLKTRSFSQGASTISQQLIKNTHLSQEKTIKRKLREFKLTKSLEKKYSKDHILEKYLNSIYFGHNCFGLKAAANFYFGKDPQSLTLSEGAILAGLIRSPNNYSPFKHPENCQRRKSVVLNAMLKQKHITSAEKERALHEPLPTKAFENTTDKSYFSRVFDELETISEKTGIPVYGKMKIYTYLDGELQKELSLLPQTDTDRIYAVFNRRLGGFSAYHSTIGSPKRLPGSVLKPLLVYAPALEEGIISPATPILDEKTDFSGYEPKNYGNTYSGYISARESLSKSLNIPAVKILSATGVKKSAEYLNRTDLQIPQDDYSLALALGGMKKGFTLTELVNAYTLFPNGGVYQEGSFIKKIVVGGKTVYRKKEKSSRIFSEETAYLVTDMLQSAIKSGTAKKLSSLPFSIAAKTGTCGNKDGNTDAYSLSYTSDYTVGVWMGNADNTLTNVTGGGVCCNHALSVHEYLAKRNKPKDFTTPNNIVRCRLDGFDYKQSQKLILADEQAPPVYCVTEIFNRKFLPKSKSERFSKPFVQTPNVAFENGLFSINTEQLPNYYSYKLERFDGEKTTIVFDGIIKNALSDTPPTGEKSYRYTLTPYYKEFMGTPIVFPNVTTKENLLPVIPETPPEIIEKDWWDY